MNPLKQEILTDPLHLGYAGKSDAQIADLLNRSTAPAPRLVPIAEIQSVLMQRQAWPALKLAEANASLSPQVRGAVLTALDLASARFETVDISLPAVQQALDLLRQNALLSADDVAAVNALASAPVSRAVQILGAGAIVTHQTVAAARRSK